MYQGGRSKETHMDSRINVSGINTLDNVYFMFFIISFGKFGNRKIRAASFSMSVASTHVRDGRSSVCLSVIHSCEISNFIPYLCFLYSLIYGCC